MDFNNFYNEQTENFLKTSNELITNIQQQVLKSIQQINSASQESSETIIKQQKTLFADWEKTRETIQKQTSETLSKETLLKQVKEFEEKIKGFQKDSEITIKSLSNNCQTIQNTILNFISENNNIILNSMKSPRTSKTSEKTKT